jgi:hypothetical protein
VSQPWARISEDAGVRTRSITLEDGEMVRFWVEPDLTNSKISIGQS